MGCDEEAGRERFGGLVTGEEVEACRTFLCKIAQVRVMIF